MWQIYLAKTTEEPEYGSNTCYTLSGKGLGVTDYNKCRQGTHWCETTGECIYGATCPECKHDFADTIYCNTNGKEECCEGDKCPTEADVCESPTRFTSGIGGSNECDSAQRFCASNGKLSWCQLMGDGLCCKYISDDQNCAWTDTYSSGI